MDTEGTNEEEKDNDKEDVKRCFSCQYKVRVLKTSSIKPGQHLCRPGERVTKIIKILGIPDKIYFYKHHFIVEKVISEDESQIKCKLEVLHFAGNNGNRGGKAIVKTETIEIDLEKDEIYIVRYKRRKVDSKSSQFKTQNTVCEEISPYNFLLNNCEHLATKTTTGCPVSLQSINLLVNIKIALFAFLEAIGNLVLELMDRDFFVDFLEMAINSLQHLHGLPLVSSIGIRLLELTVRVVLCLKGKKYMCNNCFDIEMICALIPFLYGMVLSLIAFSCFSFLSICCPVKIIGIIFLYLVSLALSFCFKKIGSKLKKEFPWEKVTLHDTDEIKEGDIISLPYYKLDHKVLCVKFSPKGPKCGDLQCIHYSFQGPFSYRKIIEEKLEVDLGKRNVHVYKCILNEADTLPAKEVIRRARLRLNEKKFNSLSNRSSHFCLWAKVGSCSSNSINRQIFEKYAIEDVHISDEIENATVVEYESAVGVVVDKRASTSRRQVRFTVICRRFGPFRSLRKETWDIDLSKEHLRRHLYIPANLRTKKAIIDKAEELFTRQARFYRRETFVLECILKHENEQN